VIKETPDNSGDYSNVASADTPRITAPRQHNQQPATSRQHHPTTSSHRTNEARITRSGSAEIHRPSDTRVILENIQDNNQDRGHQ
jgi:hypothetical protein